MESVFIPQLSTEANAASTGLKRLLLLTTGNGTIIDNWRSNGAGIPLTHNAPIPELKGPILSPLNAYRDNLLLLHGIDLTSVADLIKPPGGKYQGDLPISNGHSGHAVVWTGRPGELWHQYSVVGFLRYPSVTLVVRTCTKRSFRPNIERIRTDHKSRSPT